MSENKNEVFDRNPQFYIGLTLSLMTDKDRVDLLHYVQTNQIPILSMGKFRDLGLCKENGLPSDYATKVAAHIIVESAK